MRRLVTAGLALALTSCVTVSPTPLAPWNPTSDKAEAEYGAFLKDGTAMLSGQAFLLQRGGGTVKAAGRTVTLDPATDVGNEWWGKAGRLWEHRMQAPPSPGFHKARRTAIADADGRFRFANLPAGKYFVRTDITWDVPFHGIQGGLVGRQIEIREGQLTEVILSEFAQ